MITFASIMQRLVKFILAMVLVALVTGCGGMHRYDARLVAADSLMWADPDSALAIVTAIDSLTGERDQAYRDLLATQARYKCYAEITARDDSAITRAIDFYRHHSGDREKLTRAFLYKGAVMEELAHIDSAMYYYKTAEVTAAPKDYTNLGQINTRIADLYRVYYADKQICFEKYKQALRYYKLVGNKRLQCDCLFYMAGCSGITKNVNAGKLLEQATELALELNDSANYYRCQELLCRQLYYSDDSLAKAKHIALYCLDRYRRYVNQDLLIDLADIYALSSMPDSARYYLNIVTANNNVSKTGQYQTRISLIKSRIALLEGDTIAASRNDMQAHLVMDSVLNNKKKYQIQQIENSTNLKQTERQQETISSLGWIVKGLIGLGIISIISFVFYYRRKKNYIKSIIQELQHTKVDRHEQLLKQIDANSDIGVIGQFVKDIVSLMQTLIDSTEKDGPSTLRQRVRRGVDNVTASEDFWKALREYLDTNYNQMISTFAHNSVLSEKDLKFIELCCCGFNYVEISIIMGYTPKYISQKRKDIARKLSLDMPLQEYLNSTMTSSLPPYKATMKP